MACAHAKPGSYPPGVSELNPEPEANPGLTPAPGQVKSFLPVFTPIPTYLAPRHACQAGHVWLATSHEQMAPVAILSCPSTRLHALPQVPQSSLRFLARAAMAPLGVFNDHIDYKALLRRME